MTIAKKMILLVASALLGILILAGAAQYQMGKVYEAANYANVNTIPSFQIIAQANTAFGNLRAQAWQHVAITDQAAMAEVDQKIAANRQRVEEALNKYEKENLSDDKDRALLGAVRTSFKDYVALIDKGLAESRANHSEQARDLFLKNQSVITKVGEALQELRDYNAELGDKGAKEAVTAKSSANLMAIIIVVITVAAVGGLGFLVTRGVVRSLGEVMTVADKIALGDLSVKVEANTQDGACQKFCV